MSVGIVSFLDTSDSSKLFKYTVATYSDLSSLVDVNEGDIAWVQSYSLLNPTRFSGAWQFLGGVWVYGSKELQDQVSTNIAEIQQNEDDIVLLQNGKTDKGGYIGTSQDLKNEIDQEVDDIDAISLNPTGGAGQSYDWNTVITAGVYRGNGTTTNGPSGFNGFESVLVYTPVGTDYIVHQALDGTGTVFAFRRSNNAGVNWSVWTSVPSSSSTKEHRHIYFGARNTTDTVISFANVPVKVNGTTTPGFGTTGLVMSGLNRIVNNSGGTLRVEVNAELSIDKQQGGGKDNFVFYINQTGANLIGSKSTTEGSSNEDNTASPSWIGDMANGQWFEVWVQNIDSANDLKVSDFSLIVKEL